MFPYTVYVWNNIPTISACLLNWTYFCLYSFLVFTHIQTFGTNFPNFGTHIPTFGTHISTFVIYIPTFGTHIHTFGTLAKSGDCRKRRKTRWKRRMDRVPPPSSWDRGSSCKYISSWNIYVGYFSFYFRYKSHLPINSLCMVLVNCTLEGIHRRQMTKYN